MGLKAGIIGLPNVGKSTIFNAITKSAIPAENYPFCTIDPNIGIVEVPDIRIDQISEIFNPNIITRATVEFVDIAGLVRGASQGEGLGNQFLSHIRDVNAIIHVVRAFNEKNITHVDGNLNPIRDIGTIETELLLRDIITIEKRLEKLKKIVRTNNKDAKQELELLNYIYPLMNQGTLVCDINLDKTNNKLIQPISLLTNKPTLYVLNVDEHAFSDTNHNSLIDEIFNYAKKKGNHIILICGKIESELATLDPNDAELFLTEYNISESGLIKLIKSTYKLLNLETFFTAGAKEVKAWTISKGTLAPKAAREIHSDIERGFIKAEVYTCADLFQLKSELSLKDAGKIRQEGKQYLVKDGDIINFKFNV